MTRAADLCDRCTHERYGHYTIALDDDTLLDALNCTAYWTATDGNLDECDCPAFVEPNRASLAPTPGDQQ